MDHILIAAASIAVQIALTVVAFIWAARCLRREINSVPSSPDA